MGMFDWVQCRYPGLPQQIKFETKELDNLINHFIIEYDGSLHYQYWIPDKKEFETDPSIVPFTGTLSLWGVWPHNGRTVIYDVDFIEGYVTYVEKR